ncbi:MAG: glycosyltransferase [Pyrinomonadaceae bacterium]|nr:glycosyltransferase [Pyrinomonadaceae bacterium]MBP6213377.1 glycosyltransferase [Pyrinomonadaceae bacterium]
MNRPISVLHVVSVDKENYYLNNLVDNSLRDEVDYSFVTFAAECEFGRSLEKRGQRVYYLDSSGRREYPGAFKKLWTILKREDPDIVHTHLFDASVIALTAAKWQKRKTVLTRHHSDAIHQIAAPTKRKFYLALENYISQRSDHIIAPSRMVRDFLVEKEEVSSEKVSIIPYGQTTDRFDAITPEKIANVRAELKMNCTLALVCVSRLFHRKGHGYLFDALAGVAASGVSYTLYLVGDGDYGNVLYQKAKALGIADRVRFLGWRDDALAIMAAADIIVHPSLEDALSSAVIEAVMLEKPIVATDISGVRDSLDEGKYGEIVPPADVVGFRQGLERVIENIDAARTRARDGRKYLLEYMDAGRVSAAHVEIYRGLTKSGK